VALSWGLSILVNSRNLSDLHPKVKTLCERFIFSCAKQNIDVIITSTYRDAESQTALYNQGRTTPGKIVTNAKAGQSFHNWRVAFDFCPIVNGKCQWDNKALFTACGIIAEELGLEWAGRWNGKFKELAHCQYSGGLTLQDFQSGKTL
jgi:peptidoglycan L-alanyl-D-glutamate endopeptidase CwlK